MTIYICKSCVPDKPYFFNTNSTEEDDVQMICPFQDYDHSEWEEYKQEDYNQKQESEIKTLKERVVELCEEWELEARFLSNPHDSQADRYAGQVYKKCSELLRNILTPPTKQEE